MATLTERISDLLVALGTDYKATQTLIGNLNSLSTTEKSSLVAAINEVFTMAEAASGSGSTTINDDAISTTTTYSSSKISSVVDGLLSDGSASSSKTYSSSKIENAIAALINDSATNASKTWSANKIQTAIDAAVSNLVGTAPEALNTIQELAAALGDAGVITAINTSLGNRVRFDAPQTISPAQRTQLKDNTGLLGEEEIGDPDTDFVAIYYAARG